MAVKKGFLLLESSLGLTLLLFAIISVAYYQAAVAQWQRLAMQRFQAINEARELFDKMREDTHYIGQKEKNGFTFLIKKKPINLKNIDGLTSPAGHIYQYTAIQIIVSWHTISAKKESVTLSSGIWHT